MVKPLYRIIPISIASYFGNILGNALSLNPFITIFGYPSCFKIILRNSIPYVTIFYLAMIFTLFYSMKTFKRLYYILFLIVAWHIHNFCGFVTYSFLNLFITLPNFINFLIYFSIGTGIFIEGIYAERHTFSEYINIKCPGLNGNITFVHLTDIHLGALYGREFIQKLVNLILKENVDFVCITGDMIDGNIKMTKEMIEPFSQLKCPIYFVSGNHENYTWKEEAYKIIDSTNIKRIGNSIINFNNKVNIIGIDYIYDKNKVIGQLKYLLSNYIKNNNNNSTMPNILLYHVPIFCPKDLEKYDIFLFLCGHYHGGHFFPFTLVKFFRDKFVFEGLYNYNNRHYVYCNSGQGTSGPCVRSLSKSQIGVIKLEGNPNPW